MFYKSQGYKDVDIEFFVEYFENNKVEISFNIQEGDRYFITNFHIENKLDINKDLDNKLQSFVVDNDDFILRRVAEMT